MDQKPKWKAKTIKLLEENIGINLCDLGSGDDFVDMTQRNTSNKMKNQ